MDGSEAAIFAVDTFKQRSHIEGVVGFTVVNAGVGQVDDFTPDELQSGLGDPLPEFGIFASTAVRRFERRSEARRGGTEGVRQCRSRGWPYLKKKQNRASQC